VTHIEGAAGFEVKLDRLLVGVSDAQAKKFLAGLGQDAKRDMAEGIRQTLGSDRAMTNWPRRGKTATLGVRYDMPGPTDLVVKPDRVSAGALSMLQNGRQPRTAGGFAPGRIVNGVGGMRQRLRKVKRNVGPMAPKGTWGDGRDIVERRFPSRARDWARTVTRQAFGR
jgi:hypothetical protein